MLYLPHTGEEHGDSDMTRMVLVRVLAAALVALIGLVPCGTLLADVLLIEEVRQADRMDLPGNGINQADVRARFGQPLTTHPPLATPPSPAGTTTDGACTSSTISSSSRYSTKVRSSTRTKTEGARMRYPCAFSPTGAIDVRGRPDRNPEHSPRAR